MEIKANFATHANTCEAAKLTANDLRNITVDITGNSNG